LCAVVIKELSGDAAPGGATCTQVLAMRRV
jgi:hypothetical protein